MAFRFCSYTHTMEKKSSFTMKLQHLSKLAVALAALGCSATFLAGQSAGSSQSNSTATITSLTDLSRPRRDPTALGRVDEESNDAVDLDASRGPAPAVLNADNSDVRQVGSARRGSLPQDLSSAKISGNYNSQSLNEFIIYSHATSRMVISGIPKSSTTGRLFFHGPEKQQISKTSTNRHAWILQSGEVDSGGTEEIVPAASTVDPNGTDRLIDSRSESFEKLRDPFSGLLTEKFEGFKNLDLEQPCGPGCEFRLTDQPNSSIGLEAARSDHSTRRQYSYQQGVDLPSLELKAGKN